MLDYHLVLIEQQHMVFFAVRGSSNPTGFNGPKRKVSIPLLAIISIGIHPSKISLFSKSCKVTTSALTNSSQKTHIPLC